MRHVAGNDQAQFDDRVVALPLDTACANDDTVLAEREIGRVEEEHLADLGIKRVEGERCDGRPLIRIRQGQLQLDAVGAFDERDQLLKLRVAPRPGASLWVRP
jgi:hypothetical protein